ncbi:MAG TPA: PAS domain S-box protein [Thermoanaerobaculia bacterium]|nr:PAS domain S-box protein [Thermoanaerobaculia bacterium]
MRLLFVDDHADDVELIAAHLRRFGFDFEYERVDSRDALLRALSEQPWSAVLSDYNIPMFGAQQALEIVREHSSDMPFIVVSGMIGEETAVDLIRAGANDFVWKDRLGRLGPALQRELRDVQLRGERRSLFEALRRSDERYRRVFEKAPLGIGITTYEGRFVSVNERLAEIFGTTREVVIGRRFQDFQHPDDDPPPLKGARTQFECRAVRIDASVVWTSITLSPIASDAGELEQIVWLIEDITARKEAQERLVLQAHLLDSVEQAVVATDLSGRVIYWNRYAETLYGWSAQEVLGRMLLELGSFLRVGNVMNDVAEALKRGDSWTGEMIHYRRDGTAFPVSVMNAPLFDDGGRLAGSVAVAQDITERRRGEEALRSSREQLAAAQAIAHVGSYEYDLATGRRTWSDELFRIYGMEPQKEIDLAVADRLLHPDDVELVRKRRQGVLETLDDFDGDHRIVLPSGDVRTLHGRGHAIRDANGKPVKVVGVLQDVTEARTAERELRMRAQQQGAIAELSKVALRSVDRKTLALACELVGTRLGIEHALLFERDGDRLHHAAGACDDPDAAALLAAAAREAAVDPRQTRMLTEHSALAPFGIRSGILVPIASASSTFGVLSAFSREANRFAQADVQFVESLANILAEALERERGRHELVASEERYRAVVEGASEVIFSLSPDGFFISLNAAFDWVTGYPVDAWLGRSWLDLVHETDRAYAAAELEAAIETREAVVTELTLDCRRGPVLVEVSIIAKEKEGATFVYGFARDITAARRAEIERRELTRNLQLLLDSTAEGIITTDLEGRCTMCNAAAARMLRTTPAEILRTNVYGLLRQQHPESPIREAARTGETHSSATDSFMRTDGSTFPVEYSAAPIVDQGKRVGVVVGFTDISERLKLEAKLEQANRIASLGRLAATVAHEFNNVLMGISPFVEVLRRGRNVESSLDHIARSVKRGKRVTEDILRFTQPAEPARVTLEVQPWLQNVALEARSLLTPSCSVETHVADDALVIDGDPNQLQQIFTNLVLNARDAMPTGGLLSIRVQREKPGTKLPFGVVVNPERFAHFIVKDTGTGMSEEVLRHIFEPLFTTKRTGTGLGIPVALQVVQRHGGDMFVESAVGEGTTFHIFLPLTESALSVMEVMPATERVAAAKRVLLVEDEPSVASGIATLLEFEGVAVTTAESGEAALAALRFDVPDLIILDVGLPDVEGTVLYETIARQHPTLPVIFSTGHADRSKIEGLLGRPHVGFLLKPYDVANLLEVMREVIAAA